MFYPPTIPINFVTFLILSLFWGGVSFVFQRNKQDNSKQNWALHGLTGILASLASMLLLTAIGFIPDDWSANRIAVPLSLLYGYPLYSNLNLDPSNCNFYLPLGFLGYMPAAYLGYLFKSPTACLLFGWITTLAFYFIPFILLLYRLKINKEYKAILGLIIIVTTFSISALRYVATMIHVDALGVFLLGSAVVILLPLHEKDFRSNFAFACAGVLLGLSFFIKQTFWPASIIIISLALIFYRKTAYYLIFSLIITFLLVLILLFLSIDTKLVWLYAFKSSSSVPASMHLTQSLGVFLSSCWPLLLTSVLLGIILFPLKHRISSNADLIILFILSAINIPLSVYTFTKTGADVNHFVIPLYFLIMACICILSKIILNPLIKNHLKVFILITGFMFNTTLLINYLKTNCGWYLWVKNPHETAFQFLMQHPEESIYFPWQPLSSLLANGSMHHLDQGLLFEKITNVGQRSESNLASYLPKKPFKIAVRPFGAVSFVSESSKNKKIVSNDFPSLKEWNITIVE
jgi:hypothetical protein